MNKEFSNYELRSPRYKLEGGVILPQKTRQMIDEAIGAMRYHKLIYSDWGFADVDPTGRNMVLNFFGNPGTGKTLAAEALAGTLGLNYIHIGIAELESKFVGDTAKNISAAFLAATQEGALLFFDEADTLLGARLSTVTQGIDNEINAMRSTLLIELERFEGIVVFATNFAKNYDKAFVSRIRYHIEFELPDLDSRVMLWRKMLIEKIPLNEPREDLIQRCAEASEGFSGREIRNIMRNALSRGVLATAQEDKQLLRWEDLDSAITDLRATNRHVGKQRADEKSGSSAEIGRKMLGLADGK